MSNGVVVKREGISNCAGWNAMLVAGWSFEIVIRFDDYNDVAIHWGCNEATAMQPGQNSRDVVGDGHLIDEGAFCRVMPKVENISSEFSDVKDVIFNDHFVHH